MPGVIGGPKKDARTGGSLDDDHVIVLSVDLHDAWGAVVPAQLQGLNLTTQGSVAGPGLTDAADAGIDAMLQPLGVDVPEVIRGTEGGDSISGTDGADRIFGLDGDDLIRSEGGNDVVFGGDGNDVVWGGDDEDRLFGNDGADELSGDAGEIPFVLDETSELGVLPFQFADDRLVGGDGPDLLSGDAEAQILVDTPFVAVQPPDIDAGRPLPIGGSLAPNHLGGDDALVGGDGDDILLGDAPSLELFAQGGDDRLFGGDGDDRLFGDAYADFFIAPPVDFNDPAVLVFQAGISDFAEGGDDDLNGGDGNDMLFGDALSFGNRRSGIGSEGVGGNDRLRGGDGDDMLFGDAQQMFENATGGDDVLLGGGGNDTLYGDSADALEWLGAAGDDILRGGEGNDVLYGDARSERGDFFSVGPGPRGDDRLFGGDGDDMLNGGGGNDALDGGDGVDFAAFDGNAAEFDIESETGANQWTVARLATGEIDTVIDVEFLTFNDVTLDMSLIA